MDGGANRADVVDALHRHHRAVRRRPSSEAARGVGVGPSRVGRVRTNARVFGVLLRGVLLRGVLRGLGGGGSSASLTRGRGVRGAEGDRRRRGRARPAREAGAGAGARGAGRSNDGGCPCARARARALAGTRATRDPSTAARAWRVVTAARNITLGGGGAGGRDRLSRGEAPRGGSGGKTRARANGRRHGPRARREHDERATRGCGGAPKSGAVPNNDESGKRRKSDRGEYSAKTIGSSDVHETSTR